MIFMSPLNEQQLEQIRNERKNQIMKAAIKVFAENGIKLTKISMIAKEAGTSHGLLYHYFTSKEEVLHQSLEWAMETATIQENMEKLNALELPALEKIKTFATFAFEESNGDIFRVIQNIEKSPEVPEHTKKMVENAGSIYIELLIPFFEQGQREGTVVDGDVRELVHIFLTVISGIIIDSLEWWKNNLEYNVDMLLRMISVR